MSDATLIRPAARPGLRVSRHLTPYLLIAPVLLILAVLLAYPLAVGLYTSLTSLRIGRWDQAQFIGLDNYVRILESGDFFTAGRITFTFGLMCVAAEMPIGLGLALLLNRELTGIGVYRAICLIPLMVPNIVSALVWRSMLDPTGVINHILEPFGFMNFTWLASPDTVLWALLLIDVWMMTPQVVILLLAALQGIPKEIYEAATVDGAGGWQRFTSITFPMILPFALVSLMIRSIELIQVFDVIFVTTSGGPAHASRVLHMAAYREGFVDGYLGSGMAYAFMLGLTVLIVVLVVARRYLAAQASAYGET
ncbi:MAG TPA: sugar ABC transporter permease [Chloroflexota bacterium]|jgi:multiple sugar transport system permease protein